MIYKLNKLQILEEAMNPQQLKAFNRANNMERIGGAANIIPGPVSMIGIPAHMYAGYQAGNGLGHPVAGTLLGRDGAAGAVSKYDKNLRLKDVYTKNNMINKAVGGAAAGALTGAVLASDGDLSTGEALGGAVLGAPAGAAISATVAPAIGYGLGKVFGRKSTRK